MEKLVIKKLKELKCSNCLEVIKYAFGKKPKVCPKCDDTYWDKPDLERKLFIIQDKFLAANRDPQVLNEMYPILKIYIIKLIKKTIKGKLLYTKAQIQDKAHDCVSKVIEYYLSKPDFVIEASFGGYSRFPILGVLWGSRKDEDHDSLDFELEDNKEIYDNIDKIGYSSLSSIISNVENDVLNKSEHILDTCVSIVRKVFNTIKSNYDYMIAIITINAFLNSLHQKESFMKDYYDFFGLDVKQNVEHLRLLFLEYLHENLKVG